MSEINKETCSECGQIVWQDRIKSEIPDPKTGQYVFWHSGCFLRMQPVMSKQTEAAALRAENQRLSAELAIWHAKPDRDKQWRSEALGIIRQRTTELEKAKGERDEAIQALGAAPVESRQHSDSLWKQQNQALRAELERVKGVGVDKDTRQAQTLAPAEQEGTTNTNEDPALLKNHCKCCGVPCDRDGWCDVVIPNEVWNRAFPDEGMVCFRCITKRLNEMGERNVTLVWVADPYADIEQERNSTKQQNQALREELEKCKK